MLLDFDEKHQRFSFDQEWQVDKYDEHPCYRTRIEGSLPGTQAVDFIGCAPGSDDVFMIEVKDFRGYRIQNKKKLTTNQLALAVATKVRDSLAGLVSCKREYPHPCGLRAAAENLFSAGNSIKVVLWLEDDGADNSGEWKNQLSTQAEKIKSHLAWLTSRVLVVSSSTYQGSPPRLVVTDLAGAAGHGTKP